MPVVDAIEHHWLPLPATPLKHDLWKTILAGRSSFNGVASRGLGVDIAKQMSDQTGQLLGGPPRKDLKDEKIFSDESDSMEKLQKMDKDKVKRMEEREEELREKVEKEKRSVEDYENKKEDLQEEVQDLESEKLETEGASTSGDVPADDVDEDRSNLAPEAAPRDHEFMAQSRIVAPPYLDSIKPEDEIPVAVATTQEQYRRQKIAKDQVQVAQDQMQLAKDTQVLAQGQDKLTNLRTPGVAKEELLAEQVRDQKRIALDQELLMQSQKALAEDMHNAVDGKLRWERLEDYRKQRIEQFQDMVNEKLDRLYKEEIDFVKRNRKGKLRGAPIDIPRFGPVGVRIVSGPKAALAMGGEDGSEPLQKECLEDVAEDEAVATNEASKAPVVHSAAGALLSALMPQRLLRRRRGEFF